MHKILSVKDLKYTHVTKQGLFEPNDEFVLGPISFDVMQGETIAIIGNNGSGKSLMAKLLAGAIQASSGSIELFQIDKHNLELEQQQKNIHSEDSSKPANAVAHHESAPSETAQNEPAPNEPAQIKGKQTKVKDKPDKKQLLRALGPVKIKMNAASGAIRMILQHSSDAINPAISIGSIFHNTLKLNTNLDEKSRTKKIIETLQLVGLLNEHYYYYRHMLSDGQQQRVALARALLLDPQIIVADEPFAALDPSVRSQTINLLLKLQNELGLGFLFISHNIGIVRHISDRVFVMDKGQIVEQGATAEVFENPEQAITQKLIQSHFNLVERHFSMI